MRENVLSAAYLSSALSTHDFRCLSEVEGPYSGLYVAISTGRKRAQAAHNFNALGTQAAW